MPKRSRSQANPYTQLPYVLRIYVLSYLNKMEDNDNLTGLYGYFTDDFMRKPYRVFNRNIRIETTYNNPNNDGSSQPTIYYSGCESCELVINSIDMLNLPITLLQIQEVCKKIHRVQVTFVYKGDSNYECSDIIAAIDKNKWPANIRFGIELRKSLVEAKNLQFIEHLSQFADHKRIDSVTIMLLIHRAMSTVYHALSQKVKQLTQTQRNKLKVYIGNQCYDYRLVEFGSTNQNNNLETIETKEFWNTVGPYVKYLGLNHHWMLHDDENLTEFVMEHVMPVVRLNYLVLPTNAVNIMGEYLKLFVAPQVSIKGCGPLNNTLDIKALRKYIHLQPSVEHIVLDTVTLKSADWNKTFDVVALDDDEQPQISFKNVSIQHEQYISSYLQGPVGGSFATTSFSDFMDLVKEEHNKFFVK